MEFEVCAIEYHVIGNTPYLVKSVNLNRLQTLTLGRLTATAPLTREPKSPTTTLISCDGIDSLEEGTSSLSTFRGRALTVNFRRVKVWSTDPRSAN